MFCSVRENGFIDASMQSSSSAKSLKRLLYYKASCINMILFLYDFYSVKLTRSSEHSLCSFYCGNFLIFLLSN